MGHEWLEVVRGPSAGERLEVEDELAVGRDSSGAAALGNDPELSHSHARFSRAAGGQLIVEDLDSANGTYVNGARIDRPAVLSAGDTVKIGGSTIEVHGGAPVTSAGGELRPQQATRVSSTPAEGPSDADAGRAPVGEAIPVVGEPVLSVPRPGGRGGRRASSGRDPRISALAVLLVLALAGLIVALVAGASSGGATSDGQFDGTAYVLSNRHTADGNSVLAYRFSGARLAPLRLREYSAGGSGSLGLGPDMALDGDQQVWTNPAHTLLFAVNQGSDTIAVFHIAGEGTLTAVKGSPFPSGGKGPVSVGVSGSTLIVVNKASDNVRKLSGAVASVTTFKINGDGSLSQTGGTYSQPSSTNPTQAWVSPNGKVVFVPDLGAATILSFVRGSGGTFTPGVTTQITRAVARAGVLPKIPPSGAPPRTAIMSTGKGPPAPSALGIAGSRKAPYLFASLPTLSELVVYSYDASGRLTFVKGLAIPNGFKACWDELTPNGRFLYVGVTSNNTVAVYDVSQPANPRFVEDFKLNGTGGTFNVRVDPTGKELFALSVRDDPATPVGSGNQLHVMRIASDGRLSESSGSPVELPVDNGTSPFGLVVVGH